MAFDSNAYKREFNKQKYYQIQLAVPKDKQDDLKALAAREGLSVNGLVKTAILKAYGLDLLH